MRGRSSAAALVIAMALVVATWSVSTLFTPAPFAASRTSRVSMAVKGQWAVDEEQIGEINEDASVYSASITRRAPTENPVREYTYNHNYDKVYVDTPRLNPGAARWDIDYWLWPYTNKEEPNIYGKDTHP